MRKAAAMHNYRGQLDGWRIALAGLTLLSIVIVTFPIAWMLFAAIRPTQETLSIPPVWFPQHVTLTAFVYLLSDALLLRYIANTYVIATLTAALSIALGSLSAYGFSRFRMRGARLMLLTILALQMLPPVSLIIPFFDMAQNLDIHNTYAALVLADTAFALPISVWMLKSYFDSIPIEIEEAAMVDGCTRLAVLRRIVLPLAIPGIVGVGAFAFLLAWNEFLFAVVLTTGPNVAPLTIAISQFFTQYGRDWNSIMALNVAASVPLVVIFIFLQRWVVQGMTAGAVK
jgi:ABC-type glycerol-3-phosphate transport system permease component